VNIGTRESAFEFLPFPSDDHLCFFVGRVLAGKKPMCFRGTGLAVKRPMCFRGTGFSREEANVLSWDRL
jgi:hypothetical protein